MGYLHLFTYLQKADWGIYVIVFYVCLALCVVTILNIFYVNYSFGNKKTSFTWPLYTLKSLMSIFLSVLYIPILEYYLSIVGCTSNKQGVLVQYSFSTVVCWKDLHILHGCLSLMISFVFILICLIAVLLTFECRNSENDKMARTSSRANFVYILY